MPTSVDTTAAMNDPAEHEAAAEAPAPPDTGHTPSADADADAEASAPPDTGHTPSADAEASTPPDTGHTPSAAAGTRNALGDKKPAGAGSAVSRSAMVNVVAAALVTAMFSMLMWQISSLGDRIDIQSARIDANGARIDASSTELRAEIGGLRAEMQAGFREINATLLDHTDRLARLETAAGLPRIVVTPESPDGEPQ